MGKLTYQVLHITALYPNPQVKIIPLHRKLTSITGMQSRKALTPIKATAFKTYLSIWFLLLPALSSVNKSALQPLMTKILNL